MSALRDVDADPAGGFPLPVARKRENLGALVCAEGAALVADEQFNCAWRFIDDDRMPLAICIGRIANYRNISVR
jgi:hypothetical protein